MIVQTTFAEICDVLGDLDFKVFLIRVDRSEILLVPASTIDEAKALHETVKALLSMKGWKAVISDRS